MNKPSNKDGAIREANTVIGIDPQGNEIILPAIQAGSGWDNKDPEPDSPEWNQIVQAGLESAVAAKHEGELQIWKSVARESLPLACVRRIGGELSLDRKKLKQPNRKEPKMSLPLIKPEEDFFEEINDSTTGVDIMEAVKLRERLKEDINRHEFNEDGGFDWNFNGDEPVPPAQIDMSLQRTKKNNTPELDEVSGIIKGCYVLLSQGVKGDVVLPLLSKIEEIVARLKDRA